MNSITIGIIGIVVLVVLFLLRMPIAFTMLVVGSLGFSLLASPKAGLSLLGSEVFAQFSNYSFTVIPMFVLAGSFAFVAGLGGRLFGAAYALLGRLPGSLAIASTAACAGFAAICGSSVATAAAMGRIALPMMKKFGYDDSLATGSIAAAGTLGVLIPPSTVFIIYAILTEQSIGKLFIAGILPGILLASLFIITIAILCRRNPSLAPRGPVSTRREKIAGVIGVAETLVLFLLAIGGLSLGWFSPTQAGGALAGAVLLISLIRRQITREGFIFALKDSVRITCMVMFIVTAAIVFGRFMAVSKIPMILSDWLSGLAVPPTVIMILILILYMIGGCFMDGMALLTLTIPVIFPTVIALGYDPIWFGVMFVVVGEMGVITPPVGINVYVIKGVAEDVPLGTIFKGIFPFVAAIIVCLAILMAFPQIATFLPGLMTY